MSKPEFVAAILALTLFGASSASGVCNMTQEQAEKVQIPNLLSGKHLKIGMLEYEPFAMFDATKKGNAQWTGFDVDLIERVAANAGFTYTFTMVTPPDRSKNQTWDDAAIQGVHQNDLVLSWWTHTHARRQSMVMLLGHVDASIQIVAKVAELQEEELLDMMFQFLVPFERELWAFLVFFIIPVAGFTLSYLEFQKGELREHSTVVGTLGKSMYLAFAAFTRRDSHHPSTYFGRAFFMIWGFLLLIIFASYTASLTTFLTVGRDAVQEISSAEDLVTLGEAACYDPLLSFYSALAKQANPDLKTIAKRSSGGMEKHILDGTCKGVLMGIADARIMKRNTKSGTRAPSKDNSANCGVELVGGPLRMKEAGWVTNMNSPCVSQAVDYYLQGLVNEGTVRKFMSKWLPPMVCSSSEASELHALDTKHMSGLFIIYAAFVALSWIVRAVRYFRNREWAPDFDSAVPTSPRASRKYSAHMRDTERVDMLNTEITEILGQLAPAPVPVQNTATPPIEGNGDASTQTDSMPVATEVVMVEGAVKDIKVESGAVSPVPFALDEPSSTIEITDAAPSMELQEMHSQVSTALDTAKEQQKMVANLLSQIGQR